LLSLLNPFLKYVAGGLLFVCIMLSVALHVERVHAHKLERRVAELTAKLNAISTKRNEQKAETKTRIVTVEKQIRHADDQAKIIEQAPLPGQCRTPNAVLEADL
jgi:hypothetical protein